MRHVIPSEFAAGRISAGLILTVGIAVTIGGCGVAPQPNVVVGGDTGAGNSRPTLEIISPIADLSVGQGQTLPISWVDSDQDSAARISFALVNTQNSAVITLVSNIPENDDEGPDSFSAPTALVPRGTYNIQGTITDGTNVATVFAQTPAPNARRVVVTITGEGEQPPTSPPRVFVLTPQFDQSLAEEDILTIVVAPTALGGDGVTPYDPDSNPTLYILLDLDENPTNDDPANPGEGIILLEERALTSADTGAITFAVPVQLSEIPQRAAGEPYFIRATIVDLNNPAVHDYADGTISIVTLAFGEVDLYDAGRTVSGSVFYGFTPGARLGHHLTTLTDFDTDGADDFFMIAQFGNPRNVGRVGEAYLIYGNAGIRYGGRYPANGTAEAIQGCIFEGTPVRPYLGRQGAFTLGINDASFLPDVTGDGRPELLVGQPRVEGAFSGFDMDPSDSDPEADEEEQVTVRIRQGQVTENVGGGDVVVDATYNGVDDLVISSCQGNNCTLGDQDDPTGQNTELIWNVDPTTGTQWTLIKFRDVLTVLSDLGDQPGDIDIPEVQASLILNVFRTGDNGLIYQAFTNFDENTTYSTFAKNGADPEADVDYSFTGQGNNQGLIGTINADDTDEVTIDVSELVQQLLQGTLQGSNTGDDANDPLTEIDELRFLVQATGAFSAAPSPAAIRSSEYNANASLRPTLSITYSRNRPFAVDCYPDLITDNWTDAIPSNDDYRYYGGMVTFINSENRDNDAARAPFTRLWDTALTLELVGQEPIVLSEGFTQRAQASTPGRIDGMRVVAGLFDFRDPYLLNQPTRDDYFGYNVAWIPDMNLDTFPEIIISSPRNELHIQTLEDEYGFLGSTHLTSTLFFGSITILQGFDYGTGAFSDEEGNAMLPFRTDGACVPGGDDRTLTIPNDTFEIFAEDVEDFLHDGQFAGDVNLDNVPDVLCGAPLNDRPGIQDSGAMYIIQGKNFLGEVDLADADDPLDRYPMVRVRGSRQGDRIGWSQSSGLDVNGDRLDDVFFGSPHTDYGVARTQACGGDFNDDGVVDDDDFVLGDFNNCRDTVGEEVFTDDACKAFDYNNDGLIDDLDREVFDCLDQGGSDCCGHIVDNGYVGVIFGGITIDGDFELNQVATPDLPGTIFYGAASLDRAGTSVETAGDFNRDGYGDLLITAPGKLVTDANGRTRKGVVYLVFGGPHLTNRIYSLADVGTDRLPGIVFTSPFVAGRPNEAAPEVAALIGDINSDGYDDIGIGNAQADFINLNFPQGPEAPDGDASVGRRRNTGEVYIIYGNNFGSNRLP